MNQCFKALGFLAASGVVPPAFAQAAPADARSAAVALFQEAKKLASEGNGAAACQKFGESYSLEPQLDALLPWASCLEQAGKVATAYSAFRDAVELGQRVADPRWSTADARAKALRPRLSYLTIEVAADRVLPAFSIERDGFRLGSSAWGVPFPIDPGSHTIVVSAYGYKTWKTTVEIAGPGLSPYVDVPLLERADDAAQPAPVAPPAETPAPAPAPAPVVSPAALPPRQAVPPSDRAAAAPSRATKIAALSLTGAGLVSVGVGFYFMAKTNDTLAERDGICPTSKDCAPGTNARLADLTNQATSSQRTEIVCFALGGTAAAIGVTLWLLPLGNKAKARAALVTPFVGPSSAGLSLQGEL